MFTLDLIFHPICIIKRYMAKQNISKPPPKGSIKFSLTLSEEQKESKSNILYHGMDVLASITDAVNGLGNAGFVGLITLVLAGSLLMKKQ